MGNSSRQALTFPVGKIRRPHIALVEIITCPIGHDFKLCIDVKVVNGYIVINEVSLQLYLPNVFHFALSKNQVETIVSVCM